MMKKINYFLGAALAAMMITSCSSGKTTNETPANDQPATEAEAPAAAGAQDEAQGGVIKLADDNKFRPDTKVDQLTVLDFNAVWCVPCKKLTPAYDRAAESYGNKVKFYSVDIEKNPLTSQAFGVQSVPTVVFITPSGKLSTFVGLGDFASNEDLAKLNEQQLTDVIYQHLCKLIDENLK